jgi:hypothetical protein
MYYLLVSVASFLGGIAFYRARYCRAEFTPNRPKFAGRNRISKYQDFSSN